MHISFICYNIYVVLFTWLFPYKGPESCQLFRQVSLLIIFCHYVAVLPQDRCIANRVSSIDTSALFGKHENVQ